MGSSLKTVEENDIFWSEIGSGFGEPAAHPHQEFTGVHPFPPARVILCVSDTVLKSFAPHEIDECAAGVRLTTYNPWSTERTLP